AGILYDLGAHVIDQAIALFGSPDDFLKSYSKNRKATEVDDYAQVQLKYKEGLNVFITTNMLVADAPPAYSIYGTNGTFYKGRTDVQEEQLLADVKPLDSHYGLEVQGSEGKLTLISEDGIKKEQFIEAKKGDYMLLFDEVYNAIRKGSDYFVSQKEILTQLHVLEK
ncbi:oxidoreductase, partial [Pseudoxanthomonas sp. SGD-10]